MQNKQNSIGINALLNGIKTSLSVIFPLISYPYAARVLRVENIGKVDFSNSIVSYFVLIAGLGITNYAIREGAGIRDNRDSLSRFCSEIFSINCISAAVSAALLAITVLMVSKFHSYSNIILVQSLLIVGNLIGVNWLYTIQEDYLYITKRSLAIHIAALVLLFLFVHDENNYVMYAATTVIANVGANIFNFIHSKKYVNIRFLFHIDWKKHFKPIMIIFGTTITTTIYVNSDKTLLGFLASDYNVGLYSVAVNVYTVLKAVVAAIIMVSLPRLSNYIANEKYEKFVSTASSIFKSFVLVLMPVMIGVLMTSDTIIHIIGGPLYAEAVPSLQILSISLMFSMIATYFSHAVLLPVKKESVILRATIVSAIVNVILNFFLIPTFKQDGAAFTTLLAEFVMCIIQYIEVRKYVKLSVSFRYIISIILGCFCIVIIVLLCNLFISAFFLNLIIKVGLSALCYMFVVIILKNEGVLQLVKMIRKNNT